LADEVDIVATNPPKENKTAFEKSQMGQHAYSLPKSSADLGRYEPPRHLRRQQPIGLPEIAEIDLTRHFAALARRNVGIDNLFYPLGSCTMKLNPRINELCATLAGFANGHPLAPTALVQGSLALIAELIEILCQVTGMVAGSLVPNAGAQGEFAGIKMIAAYHRQRGDHERSEILIPDSAHGTNPASAAMVGYKTISFRSAADGDVDFEDFCRHLSERTAGLMLTNPNTLGVFSPSILKIAELVHQHGGLLYYDGANLNPLLNVARPGAMGFDVMHINLHKTFSTPHGGGGPGSGPVLCNEKLKPFLPLPRVVATGKDPETYSVEWEDEQSIGQLASFFGNFGIYLRAYLYAKLHGHYGLRKIGENATINANYLKAKLSRSFNIPYPQHCMHEFVLQADSFTEQHIRALDIAKRLLDYGVYAPTVYFPLIVKECMLIEPTETESKATLDRFVEIMEAIATEIRETPELVKNAPHTTPVGRLNDVQAAKNPLLKHCIGSP
jgi:glycine dehydrogenase subunit 2